MRACFETLIIRILLTIVLIIASPAILWIALTEKKNG